MKNYLIDTDVIVAMLNGDRKITDNLLKNQINISSISIGELYAGAYKSQKTEENIYKIKRLMLTAQVLKINKDIALQYGIIKSKLEKIGKKISINDYWIAATAIEHDLILVSRDKHFQNIDLVQIEIW